VTGDRLENSNTTAKALSASRAESVDEDVVVLTTEEREKEPGGFGVGSTSQLQENKLQSDDLGPGKQKQKMNVLYKEFWRYHDCDNHGLCKCYCSIDLTLLDVCRYVLQCVRPHIGLLGPTRAAHNLGLGFE
jgi:hypothetical protein